MSTRWGEIERERVREYENINKDKCKIICIYAIEKKGNMIKCSLNEVENVWGDFEN